MLFIDVLLGQLTEVTIGKMKSIYGKYKITKLRKKLNDILKKELINHYGNRLIYNELDKFISRGEIINRMFDMCFDASQSYKFVLAETFVIDITDSFIKLYSSKSYIGYRKEIISFLTDCYTLIFDILNDIKYSEEVRIMVNHFNKSISKLENGQREILYKMNEGLIINTPKNWENYSRVHTIRNRFYYSEGKTKFHGRTEEIGRLEAFCEYKHNDYKFLWWAITGKGGSGKTRLAYEFEKHMSKRNWRTCFFDNINYEHLNQCISDIDKNEKTLLILDYVFWNANIIGQWLSRLQTKCAHGYIVRVLLLEREGSSLQDAIWAQSILEQNNSKDSLKISFYNEDANNPLCFLNLKRLEDKYLEIIFKSFADNLEVNITDEQLETAVSALHTIDPDFTRPLFGLFIVDAILTGYAPRKWTTDGTLDYVCERECKRLNDTINNLSIISLSLPNSLFIDCQDIILFATMAGRICVDYELKEYFPDAYSDFKIAARLKGHRHIEQLFEDLDISTRIENGNLIVPSLQPDILGEYYVLKYLKEFKSQDAQELITHAWRHPEAMRDFTLRVFSDFQDLLEKWNLADTTSLKNVLSIINFPKEITSIKSGMLNECNVLQEIFIPEGVTSIGDRAFARCSGLRKIEIAKSVTSIGYAAFLDCVSLKEILIPPGVVSIGRAAFSNCINLIKIDGMENVISIGENAFAECIALNSFVCPPNLKAIKCFTFCNCISLKYIEIPASVEEILFNAFRKCDADFKNYSSVLITKNGKEYINGECKKQLHKTEARYRGGQLNKEPCNPNITM